MSSRELIQMLQKNGWYLERVVGSHHHFKHPDKQGIITVPHPRKEMKIGTLNSILKQAGLK